VYLFTTILIKNCNTSFPVTVMSDNPFAEKYIVIASSFEKFQVFSAIECRKNTTEITPSRKLIFGFYENSNIVRSECFQDCFSNFIIVKFGNVKLVFHFFHHSIGTGPECAYLALGFSVRFY